jgi:SNF2 family DNA or RNA helicase
MREQFLVSCFKSLGYVYTREGKTIILDNTPRLQLILDLVDSSEKKVILFSAFKSAIAGLSAMLTANQVEHGIIHGDVPLGKRNGIFYDFQNTPKYRVLLAHPTTMAHSLTLTAATTIIWSGPVTSLDTFLQANARIYRTGQTSKTLIAMVGGTGCEKKMYQILSRNDKTQNKFLEIVESKSSDITF